MLFSRCMTSFLFLKIYFITLAWGQVFSRSLNIQAFCYGVCGTVKFKDEALTSEQFDAILPPSGQDGEEQDGPTWMDKNTDSFRMFYSL